MDHQNEKCVMVIDEKLPTGIIANTAGIMGIISKAAQTDGDSFQYFGIGICGAKKLVNKLTGNLPLLR